jgi:membrane protease YdiL (CAAX protease family)
MQNTPSLPRQILVIVGLILLAFVLTAVAGGIWTVLLAVNLNTTPFIPWSVVVMGILLWALWRYLGGTWWPRSTAAARKRFLRARPVPARVFTWAVLAGLLSIVSLAGLWIVLFQVAGVPARSLPDYSKYPLTTVALALVMSSLVNAVVEEATYRGYVQGALERSVGGVAAIAITTLVMAPEHALTQGFLVPTLIFYAAVDVMLGTTAYLTQSILPGIVTHAVGLLVFFTLVWPGDALRTAFGHGETTAWLWVHAAQTVVFAVLAVLAFLRVARWRSSGEKWSGSGDERGGFSPQPA